MNKTFHYEAPMLLRWFAYNAGKIINPLKQELESLGVYREPKFISIVHCNDFVINLYRTTQGPMLGLFVKALQKEEVIVLGKGKTMVSATVSNRIKKFLDPIIHRRAVTNRVDQIARLYEDHVYLHRYDTQKRFGFNWFNKLFGKRIRHEFFTDSYMQYGITVKKCIGGGWTTERSLKLDPNQVFYNGSDKPYPILEFKRSITTPTFPKYHEDFIKEALNKLIK